MLDKPERASYLWRAMRTFQRFIESHASAVMLTGGMLGLIFPFGAGLPNEAIVVFLATLIFFSCFKLNAPLISTVNGRSGLFCAARFALFPLALWALARWLIPNYAAGLLLLALCPAATAAPALTGLYRGNVTLAFTLTIVSNFACVALIPLAMGLCGHGGEPIPAGLMLRTLALCILLPCALYALARKNRFATNFVGRYDRFAAVILVGMIAFLVLTKKRAYFLAHPQAVLEPALIVAVFYILSLLLGLCMRGHPSERIGYVVASALNNVALGAGLAFLYFDEKTVALFVTGEFGWCLMPFLTDRVTRRIAGTGR